MKLLLQRDKMIYTMIYGKLPFTSILKNQKYSENVGKLGK